MSNIMKSLFLLFIALLLVTGCKSEGGLSYKELQKEPRLPEWLTELETEPAEKISAEYRMARVSHSNMKEAVRSYNYLITNYSDSERLPYWLLMSAKFSLALNEDHLSYSMAQKLLELPGERACTDEDSSMPDLAAYKHEARLYMLKVLARNGLKAEFETEAAKFSPAKSNDYFLLAQSYLLLGERDNSLKMMKTMLDDSLVERPHRKSSYAAGAAAMAYSIGAYDELLEMTDWMAAEGRDSTLFIQEGNFRDYYVTQWQSSYDVVEKFRTLAKSGQGAGFSDLKDGVYKASCRGFIDIIDVEVAVEGGKVKEVKVAKHSDDRPFSAIESMGERMVDNQSLIVDTVTSATITSSAIMGATVEALGQAR